MLDRTGNMPSLPGIFPRLSGADRAESAWRPRAHHGALGHAVAGLRAQGPEFRPRRHQRAQHQVAALAPLARRREPLPRRRQWAMGLDLRAGPLPRPDGPENGPLRRGGRRGLQCRPASGGPEGARGNRCRAQGTAQRQRTPNRKYRGPGIGCRSARARQYDFDLWPFPPNRISAAASWRILQAWNPRPAQGPRAQPSLPIDRRALGSRRPHSL